MRRTKQQPNKLEVLVRRASNLKKRAGADRKRLGSIPREKLLNSCLDYVQEIRIMSGISGKERKIALDYVWGVYLILQEYNSPERHDWPKQAHRELSYDEILESIKRKNDMPIPAAEAFSGGLGFRKVNWDAPYWMASTKYTDNPLRGYWNPKEADKTHPIKKYTKKDLDTLNGKR